MRGFDFKRYAPVILLVFLVVVPLAIWAATSGGSGSNKNKTFIAERSVGLTGAPELLLTINDPDVEVTNNRTTVKIECEDAKGNVIVKRDPALAVPARGGVRAARAPGRIVRGGRAGQALPGDRHQQAPRSPRSMSRALGAASRACRDARAARRRRGTCGVHDRARPRGQPTRASPSRSRTSARRPPPAGSTCGCRPGSRP